MTAAWVAGREAVKRACGLALIPQSRGTHPSVQMLAAKLLEQCVLFFTAETTPGVCGKDEFGGRFLGQRLPCQSVRDGPTVDKLSRVEHCSICTRVHKRARLALLMRLDGDTP